MKEYKKILVTGATGFVGAYLVRLLLKRGYSIRGLKRSNSSLELLGGVHDRLEWFEGDITDIVALEEAFEGVTHVFHCAAFISFLPGDQKKMHNTNVEGTANIVNCCLYHGVKKLIYVSSIAALGRSKERLDMDEKCHWIKSKDNTNYALTKYLAEQEVWRGVAEGLSAAIVSPSVIVGSRSWDDGMAGFFKKVDKGLKFCPTGQSGFVDIRDVVEFMETILRLDISGERYILNAVNISHREFFRLIADALQVAPPNIMVGPFLVEVAWRIEWLKAKLLKTPPMVTKESARASVTKYRYHNEKSLLVPEFKYRPFNETITDTAKQYQESKLKAHVPMVLDF